MTKKKAIKTHITFVQDRTGSMDRIKAETISAFNAYKNELKGNITMSLYQFDKHLNHPVLTVVYENQKIKDIPDLTDETFKPRGYTPLYDAACMAIKKTEDITADKTIVVIQTDGEENQSTEYKQSDLKKMIEEKKSSGWEFVFLGAGIDAYAQGSALGLSKGSTLSYGIGAESTMSAYRSLGMNTMAYAQGLVGTMDFTDEQKEKAGDK